MDRAAQVGFTFRAAALTGKLLRFEAAEAPNVATRTMPRVQCPNRHIEAARRESGVNDAAAESVDLVVERQTSQPPLYQPFSNAGHIEG